MAEDGPRDDLVALLRELSAADDPAAVEASILARFGDRRAILIGDLSGFSRRTWEIGNVRTLALIERKRALCRPVLDARGACPFRQDADNFFAGFDDAGRALDAALELNRVLAEHNRRHPEEPLHVCQGIGYGDVVWWGEQDLYGHEVNLASKLGEDQAGPDEILMTPAAAENAALSVRFEVESMGPIYVGDHEFPYFRVV